MHSSKLLSIFYKIILGLFLSMIISPIIAYSQNILIVNENEGDGFTAPVQNISKITFDSKQMTIHIDDDNNKVIATMEVQSINFSFLDDLKSFLGNNDKYLAYPTPAKDLLYIKALNPDTEIGLVQIINMNGTIVYQAWFNQLSKTETVQLNISHLSHGIYICRIQNSEGSSNIKIIKS